MRKLLTSLAIVFCVGSTTLLAHALLTEPTSMLDRDAQRKQARQLSGDNNNAEALEIYKSLVADDNNKDAALSEDFSQAIRLLNQLNRTNEVDEFFENAVESHADHWRLLAEAGAQLGDNRIAPYGFIIAGKFERGNHRGGGQRATSAQRDRVRALQLVLQAIAVVKQDDSAKPPEIADIYEQLANLIGQPRHSEAWKLQSLTDLTVLPDYDKSQSYYGRGRFGMGSGSQKGAPVDENGDPVLHAVPESWNTATSDGERWRWALEESVHAVASRRSQIDMQWADFLRSQFGANGNPSGPMPLVDGVDDEADLWAVHKLPDSETIARLATGLQRFALSDEFNHIVIYQQIIDRKDKSYRAALERMIGVRMNRHQYPQAVALLKELKKNASDKDDRKRIQKRIEQITGSWGEFQSVQVQPAGTVATLDVRYRNGASISFTAQPVDIEKLLNDTKAYLQSQPKSLEYPKLQIENIGLQLIEGDRKKYLGEAVANWEQKLDPPAEHFDATKSVKTPLDKAGAWFVSGKMADGNEARMVIWIADTAITRKRIEAGTLNFVCDAVSGAPIANAELEFFGWKQQRVDRTQQYQIQTSRFADRTDKDGMCVPTQAQAQNNRGYRWLTIARTPDGRLAYDGFNSVWGAAKISKMNYSPIKVYSITDRPVYRPEHDVKFRLWLRRPRFSEDDAQFANETFVLQIKNPKGDVVLEKDATTDKWAGVDGEWTIPDDATLGQYSINIGNNATVQRSRMVKGKREVYTTKQFRSIGQGKFKVEEYRKPEFEVTIDAPTKPVMLGEKIQATVNARYYFGAPVTDATVHYKVQRTKKDTRWYPQARWDWLYSPGYWWFSPEYNWYPGWQRWGCYAPIPTWRGWNPDPPEVVVEGDAKIGEDGTFVIDIETAAALRDHSDSDHSYSITAEVVDQSRRTIIGTGSVLVAREPFKVFAWTDRGHYRTGDTATVGIQARTPDGKPVSGAGKAVLYSVTYESDKPVEKQIESWDIKTGDDGKTSLKMTLPAAGQFRIAVKVTDAEQHEADGGYLLYVRGPGDDGRGYRFNDLELIAEKQEYQPGETATLQVNTNKTGGTVLLFVRPMNGLCPKPQVVRLDGKSTTIDVKIDRDDVPNIFVEALTIADGRLHSEMRELVVPPEKKVANIEVLPSAERYKPGQEAVVQLKLTDVNGQPFVGNTVLSVYDASLEYIAASSVPEIRSFFWNVRRRHNIQNQCTLQQMSYPFNLPNELRMQRLAGENPTVNGPGHFGGGGIPYGMPRSRSMMRKSKGLAAEGMLMESAMPMAAAAMADSAMEVAADSSAPASTVEPSVRSNFADTAHWVASVTSDRDGLVEVKFKVPDNLTTWKIKAWTLGDGTRVGSGTSDIITSKDLIIRPQTPRFFTETDLITLSAVVHNYLDSAKSTTVVLETEGGQLQLLGDPQQIVKIPAGGEVRVDWNVQVIASGTAKVRMKALTDEESDAAELTVPAHVHGLLKTESFTGVIRPSGDSATVNINVPAARIEEQSRLEVRYSPTLAGAMVDALPYLIDYPYGCTEQTLNRFLPAVLTQQTLLRMGVNLADIQNKRTNLNAQEIGDAAKRATEWQRYKRNPVFDQEEMDIIVKTGVTDLSNMQLTDGGWGWFSGFGEHSTAHLTSLVVHGLTVAQKNKVPVLPDVLQRGVQWLKIQQAEELTKLKEGDWRREHPEKLKKRRKPYKMNASNMDAFVAFVLSEHDGNSPEMSDYLYRDRAKLSVYSQSLTGLVLHQQQDVPRRDMLLRNIEQLLVQDDENQTAYLRMPQNSWWYWYGSENEAMARYLQLLLKVNPNSETAPRLVKYLLNNRKHGTYWKSTRDTAMVVEAMADYLAATKEDQPNMTVEVFVDGTLQKTVKITPENLFSFDNVMLLEGDAVKTGAHKIELRRSGTGPVYFNAYLTNFTKEDQIKAAGLEVKVQRRFYKLEADDKNVDVQGNRGQVVNQQTAKFKRIPLENLASVTSGELIEVELILDSKNDYEYLLLEDRKPSGFEPDDQRSGYIFEGLRAYRELRDDRVSFFLSNLARGQHSVSYRLRAETPSQKVSALPAKIEGMYAPELVGNSDEFKLRVLDREQ